MEQSVLIILIKYNYRINSIIPWVILHGRSAFFALITTVQRIIRQLKHRWVLISDRYLVSRCLSCCCTIVWMQHQQPHPCSPYCLLLLPILILCSSAASLHAHHISLCLTRIICEQIEPVTGHNYAGMQLA